MICPVCKQSVSGGKTYRKQQYHPECYQKKIDAAKAKDSKKAAVAADPDMIALRNYILGLFTLNDLSPKISKQLENYAKEYSYSDMLFCLRYFFELTEPEREHIDEPTIGIIPYIYNEAMKYKQLMNDADKVNAHFIQSEDECVSVRPPKSSYKPLGYHIEDL